jgi:hypothetical protein
MEEMTEREAAEEAANAELQAKLRAMQEEVALEVRAISCQAIGSQWVQISRHGDPIAAARQPSVAKGRVPLASAGGVGTHRDSITGGRCRAC